MSMMTRLWPVALCLLSATTTLAKEAPERFAGHWLLNGDKSTGTPIENRTEMHVAVDGRQLTIRREEGDKGDGFKLDGSATKDTRREEFPFGTTMIIKSKCELKLLEEGAALELTYLRDLEAAGNRPGVTVSITSPPHCAYREVWHLGEDGKSLLVEQEQTKGGTNKASLVYDRQ